MPTCTIKQMPRPPVKGGIILIACFGRMCWLQEHLYQAQAGLQNSFAQLFAAVEQLGSYPGMQQMLQLHIPQLHQATSQLTAQAFGPTSNLGGLDNVQLVQVLAEQHLEPALVSCICEPFGLCDYQPTVKQKIKTAIHAGLQAAPKPGEPLLVRMVGHLAQAMPDIAAAAWELRLKEKKGMQRQAPQQFGGYGYPSVPMLLPQTSNLMSGGFGSPPFSSYGAYGSYDSRPFQQGQPGRSQPGSRPSGQPVCHYWDGRQCYRRQQPCRFSQYHYQGVSTLSPEWMARQAQNPAAPRQPRGLHPQQHQQHLLDQWDFAAWGEHVRAL